MRQTMDRSDIIPKYGSDEYKEFIGETAASIAFFDGTAVEPEMFKTRVESPRRSLPPQQQQALGHLTNGYEIQSADPVHIQ